MSPSAGASGGAAAGGRPRSFEPSSLPAAVGRIAPSLAGWLLPFLLVLYLALEDGGYGAITRGEVGIAIWWIVLLGAAIGVLPAARIGRAGWVGLGLLGAFAVWTGLGVSWSESAERSVAELGRVAMLLGVFVLALAAQREGAARRTVGAVATAIAVVALLALLSRQQPSWFPSNQVGQLLPSEGNRLSYPLGYWNGLAHLVAIGVPLMLWAASSARPTILRALATAAIPAMVLTAFLTLSRGGAGAIAVAVAVLLVLHPRRPALLSPLLLGSGGGALLIAAATQRDAFQDGLSTAAAFSQGDEMLAMTLIVCGGVGLVQAAVALSDRYGLGPRLPRPSPRSTGIAAAGAATLAVVAALALGLPGELDNQWQEFKAQGGPGTGVERLGSVSSNGRYEIWSSALDANASDPLLGIGPGTFEFWWARETPIGGFVRDAHSLYLEALAEVGIVGFALIVGFVGFVLASGVSGEARAAKRGAERRPTLAAATAGASAFAIGAAVDWDWEVTVLPVAFLLLAAVILGADGGRRTASGGPGQGFSPTPALRGGLVALSLIALVVVAIPLAGASAVSDSKAEIRAAALNRALADARTAKDVQPYAATPYLQEALVLELGGGLDGAAGAAARATAEEPTNWRLWLVRSRIEAARGRPGAAIGAYREARSLNPLSPLFAR